MSKETNVLVCYRVADYEEPPVQSVVDDCERCGHGVWRALSSPSKMDEVWCVPCARAAMQRGRDTFVVVPLTKRQVEDMEANS